MSQQDNFGSGFIIGAVVGGVLGGILGAVVATRRFGETGAEEEPLLSADPAIAKAKTKRRPLRAATEQNIETARQTLEDKIAQLNDAIDDVRQQLGGVNGNSQDADNERTFVQGP